MDDLEIIKWVALLLETTQHFADGFKKDQERLIQHYMDEYSTHCRFKEKRK